MNECLNNRSKTQLLTKIGFLFLEKMGCHEISTEIPVHSFLFRDFKNPIDNDAHYHIDLLGLEWEYLPPSKQFSVDKIKTNKREIIRGIEVKVSKSDYNNGFIHNSCNFNYLLIPRGLIEKDIIHSSIGIIEVDFENFSIHRDRPPWYGYQLKGVELIRSPKRVQISDQHIENVKNEMLTNLTNQTKRWLIDEFENNQSSFRIKEEAEG